MIDEKVWKRFVSKVDFSILSPCWLWVGSIVPGPVGGYGHFGFNGTQISAHRISFMRYKGKIPKGKEIDHLCRNRACVNPAHLEAVTKRENILRGISPSAIHARKIYCIHGHPLDYVWKNKKGNEWRYCKTCRHLAYIKRRVSIR